MRLSAKPRMGSAELISLLYRPEMLQKWIGPGVILPCREKALAILPGPGGPLTEHLVTRVVPLPSTDTSMVRITVGPIQNVTHLPTILASVIIHGIGEQQPGQTVMDFGRAVFGDDQQGTPSPR